ncbi:elongation factor Tu [Streptomyces yaizuensis]|uniref:Elongation factor Tu n=1 Tax=Streptomyces yaizuensis TaxID=2989713 RepID=A0ABQ5NZC8_9ACTN|nr:elongation factor Tu [Streptomyces sp. YSPA8]GLF95713.1 elongation factor Tu [Streptomyces sp. YSPA8]
MPTTPHIPHTPNSPYTSPAARTPVKPHLNIGTLGHTGHGKTTLTAAITKVLNARAGGAFAAATPFVPFDRLDRAPEELARGITVHLGHVEYETDTRHYAHVDMPGHVDRIRTTVAGAAGLDGAILVVSAPDGVLAQTAEHVLLARQVGVDHLVVALTKAETCDDERADQVDQDVRTLLTAQGYGGDSAPVVRVGAVGALAGLPRWTASVEALLDAVETYVPVPVRSPGAPLLLPVAHAFTVPGRGTVVTGTVERGSLRIGDSVALAGGGRGLGYGDGPQVCAVAGVESFGRRLEHARAGDRVAVLLDSVPREAVRRGQILAAPDGPAARHAFTARVRLLTAGEGGRSTPVAGGYRPQFHLRTAALTGSVDLGGPEPAWPGTTVAMTVRLVRPTLLEPGLGFAVREGGRTIGAGTVTEVL